MYPLLNDGKYFLSVVLFVVENHCQVACLLDEVVSWADVSRERSQSPFDHSQLLVDGDVRVPGWV